MTATHNKRTLVVVNFSEPHAFKPAQVKLSRLKIKFPRPIPGLCLPTSLRVRLLPVAPAVKADSSSFVHLLYPH